MQANQPRPGIKNNTNIGHVSATMDVIEGHWENENDLRNWCFSRQLKMISIMYG
jgi:hypothetical protein